MNKKELFNLVETTIKELKNIGIPVSDSIKEVVINKRAKARFGACKRKKSYIGKYSYTIEFAEALMKCDSNKAKTVVVHELLHTCPGCFNHGKKWKEYAQIIRNKMEISVNRTESYEALGLVKPETKEKIKYIVKCSGCGMEFPRRRMCKLVKTPERYRCGKCGNMLYLKNNNHNIL